jgi:hypothetical protein
LKIPRKYAMDESPVKLARDLLQVDDLDGANRIAEAEIERVADQGNSREMWGRPESVG